MKIKEKEVRVEDRYVKWFSDIGKDDVNLVGGKGANLGEMLKIEMPVPPGFVITSEAYSYFLCGTGLDKEIYEMLKIDVEDTKLLEETAKKIQEKIIAEKMPSDLKQEIIEAYDVLSVPKGMKNATEDVMKILKMQEPVFVAVRSSATAEDSSKASFAGQQETFLNVKGKEALVENVKKCFASLFTARSIYYRIKKGFKHEQVLNAVIIQIMINSDKSGVIFSRDPVTKEENVVIEAVFGLGEGVVSGRIQPDYYLVSRDLKLLKKEIANKKIAITRSSSGKQEEIKLTEDKSNQEVLNSYEVKKLTNYAIKLEKHYDIPQDIEFAIDSGNIFIVQTRPITTLQQEVKEEKIEGKILLSGLAASPGIGSGEVKLILDLRDLNKIKKGNVLVTKMTNPDMVVSMQKCSAIVTDEGGLTAHAAIVSREMGLPAVVGTKKATQVLREGIIVTVDGFKGKVYEGRLEELRKKLAIEEETVVIKPAVATKTKIKVIVDLPSFAERASRTKCKEVGLLRLEGIIAESGKHPYYFLKNNKMNEYEELIFNGIEKIGEYFDSLWIRTSDIRTDEYENLEGARKEKEANPMLGMHGIRANLKDKEILKAELKSMSRLAEKGKEVGILLPQVIFVDEVRKVKELLNKLNIENLKLGVMIETPASVQIIEDLCKEVSFISFGTNDLTQYTLAVDRGNVEVQGLYDEMHPAILSQLKHVIEVCKKYGVEISICGQAGSKKEMVEFLVKLGIDSISVNADKAYEISKFVKDLEDKGLRGSALEKVEEEKEVGQLTEQKLAEQPAEEEIEKLEEQKPVEREEKQEKKDAMGRKIYNIICEKCGKETEIPFKPKPNRSVYCKECWKEIKTGKKEKGEEKGREEKKKEGIIEKAEEVVGKVGEEIKEIGKEAKEKIEKAAEKVVEEFEEVGEEKKQEWKNVDFGFDVFSSQQKESKLTGEKAEGKTTEQTEEQELEQEEEQEELEEEELEDIKQAEEEKAREGLLEQEKDEQVLDIF